MKSKTGNVLHFVVAGVLTVAILGQAGADSLMAQATTASEIQGQINQHQQQLEKIYSQLSDLEEEQDILQEEIDDMNSEILNTMTSIGMKEDEIAAKESEIADKQVQIEETEAEYEAAVERADTQQQNMIHNIRVLYENGDDTYLRAILEGKNFSDVLNRLDYVEEIYRYDNARLAEFIETRNQVHDLWDLLEAEKAGLETEKGQLQADRQELQEQKAALDVMLDRKKQESANFEAEISKARQQAAVEKKLLQQEQQRLKALQASQRAAQSAANATYTPTDYTSVIDNSPGSELGKKVAKYACQYIGNPYVSGGTSLTNGADCSGFTYRVFGDFNYSLPRTSTQQRGSGTGVSYEEAQPGDLVCYEGHVGIYIGGGLIVHASNVKTGIKVSRAQYKTILAVRRIV